MSIDETDGFAQSLTPDDPVSRYISSLTPRAVILEEQNVDEYWYNDKQPNHHHYDKSMNIYEKTNNTSLSLPISQSQMFGQRKGSPAPRVGSVEGSSSYVEMYSPCGSSPGDPAGNVYIPMSPGIEFSRG